METRKNLSPLKWLENNFPEIHNMYMVYNRDRRLRQAREYERKKREAVVEARIRAKQGLEEKSQQ